MWSEMGKQTAQAKEVHYETLPDGHADWHTNLPRFQGARPNHVRAESSSCCLVSFGQWHVTSSPPIDKRI